MEHTHHIYKFILWDTLFLKREMCKTSWFSTHFLFAFSIFFFLNIHKSDRHTEDISEAIGGFTIDGD